MAEQQVRKLWEEHPELKGEDMGKEAMRGPEADVRSIPAEAACNQGQGDLWVALWEGLVRDPAKKQEEAVRESKEEGEWECLTTGEGLEHTVGDAMSKKEQKAVKTVKGIKGEAWEDESMEPATQVLIEPAGMREIALSERQHAWVAYDGTSQSLEVYLGGSDGIKPEEPVLRASLDLVAVIGATSASVGFTAGTWWWGCGDTDDHHLIHSFAFNTDSGFEHIVVLCLPTLPLAHTPPQCPLGSCQQHHPPKSQSNPHFPPPLSFYPDPSTSPVSPGFLPAAQPTQAPTCETTASSLHCTGFAGSTPFDLNGYAQLGPAPHFPLWLDSYDSVGSALSLAPLSLLTASARSSAFEAAFSFTFLADACAAIPVTGRGFTFVLTSGPATAVGPQNASSLGYGSAGGAFLKSVAVEFRLCPIPCIAVSSKGVVAGDGCAGAEFYTVLPPEKAFPLNTQQYAWVSYEGASQTLNVFLGGSSKVKPGVPMLTAHVDIETILGATSASVGFTGGTWWGQDMASERHIIHQLSFVGGTFLETTNVTAELTSAFAYSNETDLSLFTTTTPFTTTPTTTTTDTTTATTTTATSFSSTDALATTGTAGGAAVLSELSPDATRGTVEFRFTATTASGPQSFVGRRRIVASRPVVRAHVYVSNMEDRPMADVAVTARITYPNGTDASHCFVFSDPLLQGIDDVSGAGTLPPATSAGVDWLLLALDCAAPATPTNFKFASTLHYVLPASSSTSSSTATATSAPASEPAPVVKKVELTSVRVTVVPSPKLQVHYFVPRHVQGDDLTTPQMEAPVPVTLAALFHNSGHGTAAAVATQSLLPTAATTTTTTTTTAGAPAAADVGTTTTTAHPPSLSTVGSIPPSATAMVRWTIEASLHLLFLTHPPFLHLSPHPLLPSPLLPQVGSIPPSATAMVRWTIEASLHLLFLTHPPFLHLSPHPLLPSPLLPQVGSIPPSATAMVRWTIEASLHLLFLTHPPFLHLSPHPLLPSPLLPQVGSIPPSATAMVRWTIEASLTGTFDTVTTTNTTTSSSPLTGLSPILESVDIHNLVHVVYLPDAASDDGLPDFLVDDNGDEQPEAIYSSAGNRVLPVTAVPSAALAPGRLLFTSETRAKLTVAVDWSAFPPAAAGGWAHMSFASQLPSHCWNLTAALRSNGSQLPVPFNAWSSFFSSPGAPTGTAAAPAPATSTSTAPASSPPASLSSDTTHILDFVSSPSYTLFFSYFDQTLSFPHLSPCFQAPPSATSKPLSSPPSPSKSFSPSPPPSKPPQTPFSSPSPSPEPPTKAPLTTTPQTPVSPTSPPAQPSPEPTPSEAPIPSPSPSPTPTPESPTPAPTPQASFPPASPSPTPAPKSPTSAPTPQASFPPASPSPTPAPKSSTPAPTPQASFPPASPSPPPSPKPAQGCLGRSAYIATSIGKGIWAMAFAESHKFRCVTHLTLKRLLSRATLWMDEGPWWPQKSAEKG
ncbi:unnamed protein product [Closterium sp. NIES-65]|nr:unnamed protein product [Closterium sp. NIES-65]